MIRANKSPNLRKVSRVARRMQLVSRGTSVGLWNLRLEGSTWNSLASFCWLYSRSAWSNYAPLAMQTCSTWNAAGTPSACKSRFHVDPPSPPLLCCDGLQRFHVELTSLAYSTKWLNTKGALFTIGVVWDEPPRTFHVELTPPGSNPSLSESDPGSVTGSRDGRVPRGTHADTG